MSLKFGSGVPGVLKGLLAPSAQALEEEPEDVTAF